MKNYCNPSPDCEGLRLEAVTVSVGFDDLLDVTLGLNHSHVDHMIVVTSHDDKKTKQVAQKHGATCVPTDLINKNGRKFNKGAAINAGMAYFQYHGWRLHLDSDIALPDNFRRVLFNHTHLEKCCLYGADRVDVVGQKEIDDLKCHRYEAPQHRLRFMVDASHGGRMNGALGARFVCNLRGFVPLGYFQLWHANCQKSYPYSLGTAAHDDVMFSCLWPHAQRRLLPSTLVYHVCSKPPVWGEHWEGAARKVRLTK